MTSVHLRDRKKFQVFSGCRSKYHKHLWLGSWPPGWPSLARKYSSPPSLGLSCGISTVLRELFNGRLVLASKQDRGRKDRERQESLKSWLAKPRCPDLASVDPCCFPQIKQEAVQIVICGMIAYKPTKLVFMANEFTMYNVHLILLTYYFNSCFESLLSPVPYESSLWVMIS